MNGILSNVHKLLTPYNYNPGKTSRIKYIVIHYVGGTGSAEQNCKYHAQDKRDASAHYYVDFDLCIFIFDFFVNDNFILGVNFFFY